MISFHPIRAACVFVCLLSQTSCVVLLPFVEPHEEPDTHSNWSATPTEYAATGKSAQTASTSSNRWVRRYVQQLNDPRPTKRTAAASYLGMMGPSAAPAVPALVERLKDESKNVRRAAAKALGKIGADAQSALPALERSAKDDDAYVAHTADWAVKQIRSRVRQ